MKDLDPSFQPTSRELSGPERLADFYAENPDFDVSKSLSFLTAEYPDTDSWVVYSGLAVLLLKGERTSSTSDADIICRDQAMADDFGAKGGVKEHSDGYLDVKTIDSWLRGRSETDPEQVWHSILASSVQMNSGSATFRVMHPAMVAAAKSTLSRYEIRPKDRDDVATLQVSDNQLRSATDLIHGIDPDRNLAVLLNS